MTVGRRMKPSRNIERLIEIMAALRHPETGCPWDIEQDFHTIAPYTIEEAYEVADAIERNDHEDLREELGDLLLQVVYHARMAEEAGAFAFGDVVEAVTDKMIRRHPHVFGDETARSAGMAKGAWERIKQDERHAKAERRDAATEANPPAKGILEDIPPSLPGLTRAFKLQQRAARVGFDWQEPDGVIDKLREELDELQAELSGGDKARLEAEIGDVFFALINLARHLKIEPDTAVRGANTRFCRRFSHIEKALRDEGTRLEDASLEQMEHHWQEAKRAETAR